MPPYPNDAPWELLTRHFSGTASPDEEVTLRRWIEAEAGRAEFVSALRDAWEVSGRLPERHDSAAGWERVRRRIREWAPTLSESRSENIPPEAPLELRADSGTSRRHLSILPERPRREWLISVVRVAAAVVGIVGVSTVSWRPLREALSSFVRPPAAPARVAFLEASTGRGQRAMLRLADGTRVTLGMASALQYPESFTPSARNVRDVFLSGEAYFEVAPDSLRPFIVHARGAETRVIGTRFVVRGYAGDEAVIVAVQEGRVALSPAHPAGPDEERGVSTTRALTNALVLTVGLVGRLPPGGPATVVRGAKVREYFAWAEGRLVFRETPLRAVLSDLSRWYDLDVRFASGADSLGARRFTGSFTTQPPDEVLTFLALATDVRAERNGRSVTISPRRVP